MRRCDHTGDGTAACHAPLATYIEGVRRNSVQGSGDEQGWRRVRYDSVAIGVAHRSADIRVFLASAGLEI